MSVSVSAATSVFTSTGTQISPGSSSTSLGRLSVNHTSNITGVSDNSVFNTSYTETGSVNGTTMFNVTASVPGDFPAGTGSYTVFVQTVNSSASTSVSYTVEELRNWTVTEAEFLKRVNTGSRGRYGNLTLVENGNVEETVNLQVTGELMEYITVDRTVSLPPDNPQSVNINFNVPRTTVFGNYTGALHINSTSANISIPLETVFVDNILPRVEQVEVEDVQATQPEFATVRVTDNLEVRNVEGRVVHQVVSNNNTVNTTVTSLTFSKDDGATGVWRVLPPANDTGTFWLKGTVTDTSNNSVTFTERYEVSPLDVISSRGTIRVPRFRVESEARPVIATLGEKTSLTVRLESFNQPLESRGNETWNLAVESPSGDREYFSQVNDSVTVSGKGDVKLFIRSTTAEVYTGELSLSGVKQHVSVEDVSFSGEFVNFTVPESQNFTVFGTRHLCKAVRSDQLNKSGWNCDYFVSAGVVAPGTTLGDNVRTVIPSDVQANFVDEKNSQITRLQNSLRRERQIRWGVIALMLVVLTGSVYVTRFAEEDYVAWLREPRRASAQRDEMRGGK